MIKSDLLAILEEQMPSFDFSDHDKRLQAFMTTQTHVHRFIENEELNEDEAVILLSLLFNKNTDFKKATLMIAVCLEHMAMDAILPIGVRFANEIRDDLGLAPI